MLCCPRQRPSSRLDWPVLLHPAATMARFFKISRLGRHAFSAPHETRMATSGADVQNPGWSRWRPITTAVVLRQVPRPSPEAPAKLLRLRASSPRPAPAAGLVHSLTAAKSHHPPIRRTHQRLRAQFVRFHHPPTRPSQHHASTIVTTRVPDTPNVPPLRRAEQMPSSAEHQAQASPQATSRPSRAYRLANQLTNKGWREQGHRSYLASLGRGGL